MPPLPQIIQQEIAESGPIPFKRFMELALYCPEVGFYEKEGDNVGRAGDFYTSVSVGPLFGELLAFQFARWFSDSGAGRLQLIEAGAHDGRLAADILGWFQRQRPELLARLEYHILEPSARRRDWQARTLNDFQAHVRWADGIGSLDPVAADVRRLTPIPGSDGASARRLLRDDEPPCTIIFSNELLDAMPVQRFGWDAVKREWFEWGVTTEGERFIWTRLPSVPLLGEAGGGFSGLPTSPELLDVLPDGYTLETSPAADAWWAGAARWLQRGRLLTFDYGFAAADWILPERTNGTLRAYRNHQLADDVLADPGEQDLTAHVNFPGIESVGNAGGLKTETFETQGRFLTSLASEAWKPGSGFGEWDQKRTRQFQTLTHPGHLGRSFRVLVQSRD